MSLIRGITLWCVWLCLWEVSWGAVKQYKFDVEYMYGEPDCVEQVVIGINGQFPGPTITAEEGDTLHIILTNNLFREGTVLHWHGIRQVFIHYFFIFFFFVSNKFLYLKYQNIIS